MAATTSVVASVTTLTSNGDVQSKNQKKVKKRYKFVVKVYQNLPLILASVVAAALLFRKPPQYTD